MKAKIPTTTQKNKAPKTMSTSIKPTLALLALYSDRFVFNSIYAFNKSRINLKMKQAIEMA